MEFHIPGSVWTELGPPSVRGNFHLDKLASKYPLTSGTSPPNSLWDATQRFSFSNYLSPNAAHLVNVANQRRVLGVYGSRCNRWDKHSQPTPSCSLVPSHLFKASREDKKWASRGDCPFSPHLGLGLLGDAPKVVEICFICRPVKLPGSPLEQLRIWAGLI